MNSDQIARRLAMAIEIAAIMLFTAATAHCQYLTKVKFAMTWPGIPNYPIPAAIDRQGTNMTDAIAHLIPKFMLAAVILAGGWGIGRILAYDKAKAVDFIMHNFDKLLVFALLMGASAWINTLVIYKADAGNVDKAWQVLFTILGLLTGLITGQRAMLRKADEVNGNKPPDDSAPPAPPSPAVPTPTPEGEHNNA